MLDDSEYYITSDKVISGTLMWYYKICKREVWLMAREIHPDEDNQLLDLGRAVHEIHTRGGTKEIALDGVRFDMYFMNRRFVFEIKTSSRYLEAAKLQIKYYLYRLRGMGIDAVGYITIPRERRRFMVNLTEEDIRNLNKIFDEIRRIVMRDKPPKPVRIPFCRKCAYRDFCWV